MATGGASCATAGDAWGDRVAASARWYLQHREVFGRRDCSGLVEAVLKKAGLLASGNTRTFWHDARNGQRLVNDPRPGDLVFFDRTYDANRNGRVDDELTHIAIVVAIEPGGTVQMVHFGSGRIRALRMNLGHRHLHRKDGRVLNDFLRSPRYGQKNTPRLAGELFRGFARPPEPPAS